MTLDDCFLVTVWLDVINSPAFNISQYKPRSTDNMYLVYPKPLRSFKLVFTFFECHIVLKNVPNSFLVNTNSFCDFYKVLRLGLLLNGLSIPFGHTTLFFSDYWTFPDC